MRHSEPQANLVPKSIQSHPLRIFCCENRKIEHDQKILTSSKPMQDRPSINPFDIKSDVKTAKQFDKIIESLELQFNSVIRQNISANNESPIKSTKYINDPKKMVSTDKINKPNDLKEALFSMVLQITQQVLINHHSEVKLLKSEIQNEKSFFKNLLTRISDTLQENKGHLNQFQNFVLELIKIQGNEILLDSERNIKMQMLASHIQTAASRINIERIEKDIENIKTMLQKNFNNEFEVLNNCIESERETHISPESKYLQQLEKLRLENEMLQSKTGALESRIQEVENFSMTNNNFDKNDKENHKHKYSMPDVIMNDAMLFSNKDQDSQIENSRITVIDVSPVKERDPKRCAKILSYILLELNKNRKQDISDVNIQIS